MMTKACIEGWIECAGEYLKDGKLPVNRDWKELMVEALLTRIDDLENELEKLAPEPELTQKELKYIRKIIQGEIA